ncbi:MAG: hypothetical protein C5S49_06780 [Candidatus Methanogaster sp.]|nr:MAG: hypothetical protein C5S49_06780 [ANME-2 cluster archaeon]
MELNADNHQGLMNTAMGICVCMLLLSAVPACAGMSAVTTPATNAGTDEIWYRSGQPATRFLGDASRDTGRSVYARDYFANSTKPSIISSCAFIQPEPAGDLDGDGAEDVLVGFGSYDSSKWFLLDRIDAVSGSNGTVLWSITHDVNRHICASRAGNLNGDDKDDVLTFTIRYDSGTDTYTLDSISALSGDDGAVLWSKDINNDLWSVWTEFDINGDGMAEIMVQYESYESSIEMDCIDEIYILNGDGSLLWRKTPGNWVDAYPAGDLDGNGGGDLLVYTQSFSTGWTTGISAIEGSDGHTLWSETTSEENTWIGPADPAGDLNNDGKDDVLVRHEIWDLPAGDCMTVYALHGNSGSVIWSNVSTAPDSWMNAYPAGDLNGDGKDDVLLYPWMYNPLTDRYYSDIVYAKRGYDNQLLWTKTGTDMYYMRAGDLNRDGADDLLFYERSYDASTDTYLPTVVSALNGRDRSTLWAKARSGRDYIDALPAGDLNGDGGADVAVYNINCGSYDPSLDEFYFDSISAVNGSDGSALWSKSRRENGWIDTWYIGETGDLDADGTDDVLVCTYIYNSIGNQHILTIVSAVRGEDGSVLWSKSALRGDLDFDGTLSTTDAMIALRMAVRGECFQDADVSGNGAVTSLDAMMILQAAAGAIDPL